MRPIPGAKVRTWLGRALLLAGILALLHGSSVWWPRTVDDAYITFRYAQRLVEGEGPTYNPGERVEGYSSPSFMLLSAAVLAAGGDPERASKVVGVLSSLVLLLALFLGLRRVGADAAGAGGAAVLLGSSMVLAIWSTAGLETNLYAVLFFCGLLFLAQESGPRATICASSFLALAALTRPEGLVFWVLGSGTLLLARRSERRRALVVYLAPGALLAAHLLFRLAYYGAPVPNTYYVKTGGGAEMWKQGVLGLLSFLRTPTHAVVVLAAIGGSLAALRHRAGRPALVMGGAVLLHLAYVVSVGDDGLRIHRFYVPVLAPLAFLVGLLFLPRSRVSAIAGWIAVAVVVPLSILALGGEWTGTTRDRQLRYQEGNEKLGRFLRSTRDPASVIAVASAGAIPYYSRLRTIDMYGLNDATIARRPFPDLHRGRMMKWDNGYVLSLKPDLIVINSGYCRAGDPRAERAARDPSVLVTSSMDFDLFRRVGQDGGYALRRIEFEDGSSFFVFERSG